MNRRWRMKSPAVLPWFDPVTADLHLTANPEIGARVLISTWAVQYHLRKAPQRAARHQRCGTRVPAPAKARPLPGLLLESG